jgi:hypothetical protein
LNIYIWIIGLFKKEPSDLYTFFFVCEHLKYIKRPIITASRLFLPTMYNLTRQYNFISDASI